MVIDEKKIQTLYRHLRIKFKKIGATIAKSKTHDDAINVEFEWQCAPFPKIDRTKVLSGRIKFTPEELEKYISPIYGDGENIAEHRMEVVRQIIIDKLRSGVPDNYWNVIAKKPEKNPPW